MVVSIVTVQLDRGSRLSCFAIVIVGGLIADLVMSIFLLPTLYLWMAGERDLLPEREAEFDEQA
jgi:hypothetical protein